MREFAERQKRAFGLAACLLLCVPFSVAAQTADEAALRALLETFFASYRAGEFDGLMALWSKDSANRDAGAEAIKRDLAGHEKLALRNLAVTGLTVEGGKASARVTVEAAEAEGSSGGPAKGGRKVNRTLQFVKEGGAWKVWRYVPTEDELAAELIRAGGVGREALLERERELVTPELVGAIIMQGRTHYFRDEFPQARAVYDLAVRVAEKIGDKAGATVALRQIGNIHSSQGSYAEAMDYFRRSLKLAEELGDKLAVAGALNNMGNVVDWLGDTAGALEYYERSLTLAAEVRHQGLLTLLYNNIGLIYLSHGDAVRSLDSIQKSLKLAEELNDRTSASRALHNIGIIHAGQGNYEQALEHYRKSLAIEEGMEGAEGKTNIPKILGNMGLAHAAHGEGALALEYHGKALKSAEELGDKEVIAGTLNNIGNVYGDRGEYARALEYFRRSLELAEGMGNKVIIASARRAIGEAHFRLGEYRKAADYAEQAAAVSRQAGRHDVLWNARTLSGKAHLALGEFEPARRSLLDAISTVEMLRGNVAGGESARQRFFERKVEPYYAMISLLLARRDDFQALTYAERAKGRVLLDVLSNGRVNISKAMTAEEQARERALNSDITALNTQIYRETSAGRPDPARLKELDARLQKARLDYESFQFNLYASRPELKLRRGETPSLTWNQLAALLPDDKTALLEFVVGADASHLFVLTRGAGGGGPRAAVELKTYRLNVKAKELVALVEDFRKRLAERNLNFREQARQLYALLVEPAREQLRGKTLLCIVPDGALWELPFQALQPRDDSYLIEDHALFYAPSLSVLHGVVKMSEKGGGAAVRGGRVQAAAARGRQATRPRPPDASAPREPVLLAFGNPELDRRSVEIAKSVYRDEKLGPLPEAEREVKALEKFYTPARSRVYVGAQAREERAKAEVEDYRVLHFATHGILDDRNPMYSHVLLSQAGGGGKEDGLLHAWEIMNLDLKADMVVLSACQTARGRLGAGEGVIGMGWALFVAGSPTTVVSLWKVESSSTTELMVGFHRNLLAAGAGRGARPRKAEALRAASLELLRSERFRHPFYWAGFVMTGNGM